MRKIRYNGDVYEKIMVWPGYLTENKPKALKEIENQTGGHFTARPRMGSRGSISKEIKVKMRATVWISILFQEDGTIDFLIIGRSKTVQVEYMEEICAWFMNAMDVFAKTGLI